MILAFDTHYKDQKAKTVCVSFANWTDSEPCNIFSEILHGISEYEPGAFYKRELPCILSLLQKIPEGSVDFIVVDGFVVLDDGGKPGLGAHLFNNLDQKVPVIGVAKSSFFENSKHVRELKRGSSKNPLYVTAMGVDLGEAYEMIKNMHGSFRIPTLLQLLDSQSKNWLAK